MAEKLDPVIYESILEYNKNLLQRLEILSQVYLFSVAWISNYANRIPSLFINLLITIISSFFFTTDYQNIVTFLLNQLKTKSSFFIIKCSRIPRFNHQEVH